MESSIKKCPYCAEEILSDAIKCKHCGEWLDGKKVESGAAKPKDPEYSNFQETDQFVIISLLSFFLYAIYWYYRSWKYLKTYEKLDISPFWRTVGSLVPIVNIFLDYSLFSKIKNFGQKEGCVTYTSAGLLTFINAVLGLIVWIFILIERKTSNMGTYFFVNILEILLISISLWIPATVQNTLNNIWEKKQPGLKIRVKYSDGQIVVIIFGIILWLSFFIQLISGPK